MKKNDLYLMVLSLALNISIIFPNILYGAISPIDTGVEKRIKILNYNKNAVHKYTGFYYFQSSIVFEDGEEIATISMGYAGGWQINPLKNRLFIKPVELNADTNATIITNKRVYHFELIAEDAVDLHDPRIAYEVRMSYSNADPIMQISNLMNFNAENSTNGSVSDTLASFIINDLENKNFDYKISGSQSILPVLIFDDTRNTYMKFAGEIPAIFTVNPYGEEEIINFRALEGGFISIERVDSLFTLRYGKDVVCVFNGNKPFKKAPDFKRRRSGILSE